MNINSQIKTIIFDLYGTLAFFDPSREKIQKKAASKFGYSLSFEGINKGYFEAQKFFDYQNSIKLISKLNSEEKYQFFSKYEQLILKGDNIDVNLNESGKIWELVSIQNYEMILYPDVMNTLRSLGNNFNLGLATNIDLTSQEISNKFQLGGLMDFIFTSKDLNLVKPDKKFFRKILLGTKTEKDKILYIGDQIQNDIMPAMSLGFKTILMDRYNQFSGKSICPVVRNMDEIIKLL